MRLQSQHHTALCGVEGEVLTKRANAVAGGDDVAVGSGVLDVAILHVGGKHFPCLHDVLPALHEVGGVKDGLQAGDGLMDGEASGGVLAVDALLIFVARDDSLLLTEITEDIQTAADLLEVGLLAACAVEGKEADALGLEDIRHIQQMLEGGDILLKVPVDPGLTCGRADGPDLNPRGIQLGLELQGGLAGEVSDVGAVHTADLQVGDFVLGQGPDLAQAVGVGLVGKAAELDMSHRIHGASLKYYTEYGKGASAYGSRTQSCTNYIINISVCKEFREKSHKKFAAHRGVSRESAKEWVCAQRDQT